MSSLSRANWPIVRDDVIRTIQQGLVGQPDLIFAETSRILNGPGADETIAWLTTRQTEIPAQVEALTQRESNCSRKNNRR